MNASDINQPVTVKVNVKGTEREVDGILRGISGVWLIVQINKQRFMVEAEKVSVKRIA